MPPSTNHLAHESSPYLLQHQHNPVDWYPWGEDALNRARAEDKPIFLSIGYAACHWCHVMEKESFESEEIGQLLNQHFVAIKVDREERPDLDEIYMTAVQLLTGSGGWPMSVFLTPELKPFYGGTYFPPEDRFGRPGFKTLLLRIAEVWQSQRDDLDQSADEITNAIRQHTDGPRQGQALPPDTIAQAAGSIGRNFDKRFGGFGGAPKFPSAPAIMLMLRHAADSGDDDALAMATQTLDQMARGGLYDQLGGGFHRYSVDEKWLVPHFEKMLYDNGQLVQAYLEGWQATGNPLYERVVRETLGYVTTQMTDESGAFYSTEDADSEGEEGKFYVWTLDQLAEVLDAEELRLLCAWYNVTDAGNFSSHEPYHDRQNILHVTTSAEAFAEQHEMTVDAWLHRLESCKQKLLRVREGRVRPGLDDKVITAWNGLMISAFARACQVFRDDAWLVTAGKAADFLLGDLRPDGELQHTWRHGTAKLPAYLDDYSYLIQALIDLYEAGFELRYLTAAAELAEEMNRRFWDAESGGYFYTEAGNADLIARTKSFYDGATPSGNSMAATALLRLAALLDNDAYRQQATRLLELARQGIGQQPRGHVQMLLAAHFHLSTPREIAIAGPLDDAETRKLLQTVHAHFLPAKVLAQIDPDSDAAEALGQRVPLLAGKGRVDGKPAAYVCRDYACSAPVTESDALARQLAGGGA